MDARAHRRVDVDKEIACKINGVAEWVHLYDLSAGGCSIEVGSIQIQIGDSIHLNLHDLISINGEVAWKIENNAGVRFDGLIAEVIVEHLGFNPSSLAFDELLPRDRYGRKLQELPQDLAHFRNEELSDYQRSLRDWRDTARLQDDRRNDDRGEALRRREDRLAVDATARLCPTMYDAVEGYITDLSTTGCSFLDHSRSFSPGCQVWLRVGSLEPWKGVVRWANGDKVGIQFDRSFYPAVVEHLVKSNRPVVCSAAG